MILGVFCKNLIILWVDCFIFLFVRTSRGRTRNFLSVLALKVSHCMIAEYRKKMVFVYEGLRYILVPSPFCGFVFCGFSYLWSAVVPEY